MCLVGIFGRSNRLRSKPTQSGQANNSIQLSGTTCSAVVAETLCFANLGAIVVRPTGECGVTAYI